jgi:hypothetical protein
MSQVSKIMERHYQTIELDGVIYVVHRWTTATAIEALGPGALMFIAGDSESQVSNAEKVAQGYDLMRKVLTTCMISPRLGEKDDPDNDTVSWLTLGEHVEKIYSAIMEESANKARGFSEPSEDRRAS